MSSTPIIFAGAPYSNSAPLVDKLTEVDPRVTIINDHPANLVADLKAGKADVALIPVAHLFRHPELTMLEGLGVAAAGPVKSVLLKCHVPLQEINTVQRDPASATSNALAELLMQKHYGRAVTMLDVEADAQVVIGDRALCAAPAAAGDIDLAEAWQEMTGLPFVFAVWAVRHDYAAIDTATEIALKAWQAGMNSLDEIAVRYSRELGQSVPFWRDYLKEIIHYQLTDADYEGLHLFRKLLASD